MNSRSLKARVATLEGLKVSESEAITTLAGFLVVAFSIRGKKRLVCKKLMDLLRSIPNAK